MSAEGAVLFARYAYPPNALGYCGPAGADALLDRDAVADIDRRARAFEGAWVYLELLAEELGLADPLATDVVEAYWIGSDRLLDIEPGVLVRRLQQRFRGQEGGTWLEAGSRALAHHSFQVFEVYPWASLLQSGRQPAPAVQVLDRCRIRAGVVRRVTGETAEVTSRPLAWRASALRPGPSVTEHVRWSVDGRALITRPTVGDVVALHWDWVCDRLSSEQAELLTALEARQLAAVGLAGP